MPGTPGKIIIKNWRTPYDPTNPTAVAGSYSNLIKVTLDVTNPSTPKLPTTPFKISTTWNQSPGDLVDQNTNFATLNINGGLIIVSMLEERYEHPYPICGGRRGPITFSMKWRNTYKFPNDFFKIDFYNTISMPTGYQEILCYFRQDGMPKRYNIKSFRCDWNPTGGVGGQLNVYAPEEMDIVAGTLYYLTITTRGAPFGYPDNWGVNIYSPSNVLWVVFTTSSNLERGWL